MVAAVGVRAVVAALGTESGPTVVAVLGTESGPTVVAAVGVAAVVTELLSLTVFAGQLRNDSLSLLSHIGTPTTPAILPTEAERTITMQITNGISEQQRRQHERRAGMGNVRSGSRGESVAVVCLLWLSVCILFAPVVQTELSWEQCTASALTTDPAMHRSRAPSALRAVSTYWPSYT